MTKRKKDKGIKAYAEGVLGDIKRPAWWLRKRATGLGQCKTLDAVLIGNQVIFELSCDKPKGPFAPAEYFIVRDEETGWSYLVWDMNTKGQKFSGKFKNPKKSL